MTARSKAGARRLPFWQGCASPIGAARAVAIAVAAALGSVSSLPATAQSAWPDLGFPLGQVQESTRILVLDQERLFTESRFGRRVNADIDARSREVVAENRRLESELEQEERDLTAQRPRLEPAEFRARADAFNAKVQRIRAEQDAKARALATFRESEQQRFLQALAPVLTELAAERSAVAILDKRLLLVAAESIDITSAAIERVDAQIGEGSALPAGPQPEAKPQGFENTAPAPGTEGGTSAPQGTVAPAEPAPETSPPTETAPSSAPAPAPATDGAAAPEAPRPAGN